MAAFIKETQGIKDAVSLINGIDQNKYSRLLSRILQKLHLKCERTFSEEEEDKLQAALSLDKAALGLVLETSAFILEQAVYNGVKPAALRQQLEAVGLSSERAEAVSQAWASAGPELVEKHRQGIFTPNKLERVGWQLNLQLSQSSQTKLKTPHAVLELGLNSETSEGSQVFVEFSHQELLEFYNKLETVQTQLDSLT